MPEARFDFDAVFDPETYLYFYEPMLTPENSEQETDVVWQLLEIGPGMEVLDLACGFGRIANRLAARGARVTGLDASEAFLEMARRDAEDRDVEVELLHGDMRSIPWTERFDRVISWFTSYGYFEDDDNRRVLAEVFGALRPGGRFLIETMNRDLVTRNFQHHWVETRDGNSMIDRNEFDPVAGRLSTKRTIVWSDDRPDEEAHFFCRIFTASELPSWLLDAGFSEVEAFGTNGEPYSIDSRRMILVATK